MIQLDEKKLAKLKTTNQLLDEKYGKHGTASRESFNERTMAWYYGDILRERRKELKLTQKQLAQKIGKEQSYIARVEKGEADIQLSSFFRIALTYCHAELVKCLFSCVPPTALRVPHAPLLRYIRPVPVQTRRDIPAVCPHRHSE